MGIATILEVRVESAFLHAISKAVCDPVCIICFRRMEMCQGMHKKRPGPCRYLVGLFLQCRDPA